jgi:hypothetical protein
MPGPPPFQRFHTMLTGAWVTASMYAATVLGIPDLLAGGPRSVEDLAAATRAKPDPLRRLLRALAAQGVFSEREDGRFGATELSTFLCEGVPGSSRAFMLMYGGDAFWSSWGRMLHSIRTGRTAYSEVHGAEIFEHMQDNPEQAAIFNQAMTQGSARLADEIVASYDFSPFDTIVDVGGGQGWLLSAILAATPTARGILYDLPQVVDSARPVVAERGMATRCELVTGSFFEAVPPGGDAYIMKWIIHDWDDAHATKILQNVRAVIPPDGRLIVFDRVLPTRITEGDPVTQMGTLMDLNMLVNVSGRERTEAEFRTLLGGAGFRLAAARSTASGLGIVEGVPA